MRSAATLTACFVVLLVPGALRAQPSQAPAISVPRLIKITGVFRPADGGPPGREVVTLAIYANETGGEPLWDETQAIDVDPSGRYTLLLGATQADGVPLDVFASGEAQWLGVTWVRPGEVEGVRMRLTSVPYALRASDADTLGGKPASAYLVAPTGDGAGTISTATATTSSDVPVSRQAVLPGTTNVLAKYANGVDVGPSAVYESAGLVGINTTTPADVVHAAFTNPGGTMTGIAVQNLANTATSYSGMLFYDHTGALGQFQGFNNVTKEYRINNVAPGGSINFMTGGTSRFLVHNSGNIGIGTTSPAAALEVSRNTPTSIFSSSYGSGAPFIFYPSGPSFEGRRARGTVAAPAAVLNGDRLASFIGSGYDSAVWGPGAEISMVAAEDWSSTGVVPFRHRGTDIRFSSVSRFDVLGNLRTRMLMRDTGEILMPGAFLTVSNESSVGLPPRPRITLIDNHWVSEVGGPAFIASEHTSTLAVLNGDTLVSIAGTGDSGGGSEWVRTGIVEVGGAGGGAAEIALRAAEDWSDFSQGTEIRFRTTTNGNTAASERMIIDGVGNLGIGTTAPLDKLQVVGDIRVGTSGTNGCVRRFDGGAIVGTCASDKRFKKDITPFTAMLRSVSALQPVHYSWRTTEFPERHFGNSRAYGLIAQDVEQILPELVVTQDDGYKAIDYTKLPLLTIQAVKELKAENDALKSRVAELETLRQRVAELERLVNELLVINARR